ncbi:papain-like cysteine protease family protein [Pandoraea pulmonicola]|uniref:Peptidase C39-like domain-containing protein n=1 Tax=Pandoraea pulmonicola TaxID=93221 RepID=A0AAJ4ZA78_PANPU|nr:papain-like cysteine protease family protein [Pandoraea pulmonicola]SUA89638.1 Uncharacterised protein [Pandoraea pulmonicola]
MTSSNEKQLPACLSLQRLSLSSKNRPNHSGATGSELIGVPGGATTSYPDYFKPQEHDTWCWVAVTSSLRNYYYPEDNGKWTQAAMVSHMYNLAPGTCSDANYARNRKICDKGGSTLSALHAFGLFVRSVKGMPAIRSLENELILNSPFVVRLLPKKPRPGGHAVVIAAIANVAANAMWLVCDPWTVAIQWVPVSNFPTQYKDARGSVWANTYYTGKVGA